jgi:hypothetical protein
MWANVLTSNISGKTLSLALGVLILDIVSDDNRNEKDILSDTLSISQDVYALLADPDNEDNFLTAESITLDPIFEGLPDKVNGWLMTVNVELAYESNRCQIPLK